MASDYTPLNKFRYERKFVAREADRGRIDLLIRSSSAIFKEAYPPRRVNNIYFDTPGLDCYHDNLFGVSQRWKARIRWYGDNYDYIERPILELKIKHGHIGTKKSWRLKPIDFSGEQPYSTVLRKVLKESDLPLDIESRLISMQAVLLNHYERDYYLSADKRFRLTVDKDLRYRNFGKDQHSSKRVFREKGKIVLELKYDFEHDRDASRVSKDIPFRLNKNSKFVSGMTFLWPGVAQ